VQVKKLDMEMEELVVQWKKARKESDSARDAARHVYDMKLEEANAFKEANSVTTLVGAAADRPWHSQLEAFYLGQKQWELERVNKRRVRLDLPAKSLDQISVNFSGILIGDKIYIYHPDVEKLNTKVRLLVCVFLVTVVWIVTTLITPAADKQTLRKFYKLCHPGGPGWKKVVREAREDGEEIDEKNAIGDWKLPMQILCVFLGCITIYSSLFAVGNFVYGNMAWGYVLIALAVISIVVLFKCFGKIGVESSS